MHPLVILAISEQDRAERARTDALIWRNAHAREVPLVALQRDGRWAAMMAKWARPEPESATVGCATVGCATA